MVEQLAIVGASITMPDGLPALRPVHWMPLQLPEPAFVVGEIEVDPDQTFDRGLDGVTVVCRVLVAHTDDRAAAHYLNLCLAGSGPTSIIAALKANKTLNGTCKTSHCKAVRGRRLYQWGGATEYLGCEFHIYVWGSGA